MLSKRLEEALPEVIFALLFGSAQEGVVPPHGDLDLAFYLTEKSDISFYRRVDEAVAGVMADNVRVDVGFLRDADPVYRFEALKGKLLFCRNQEIWIDFFSLTCRLYESQMASYRRQHRYRLEVMGEA